MPLARLLHTPTLLWPGTFDQAKGEAAQQGRWLLINVQQNEEFDSHRLNRDTWSQPHVQEVVRGMFVFWQVRAAPDCGGCQCHHSYHELRLPCLCCTMCCCGALVPLAEAQTQLSPQAGAPEPLRHLAPDPPPAIGVQVYDTAPEGKRVVGAYHMNQFPVIAIVDPITGEGSQGVVGP
jgi:hypothetical protein